MFNTLPENKTKNLRDFLNAEIKRRGLSMRQFAEQVGVSHTVISRATSERNPIIPSYATLAKIAKATGVDVLTLVSLAEPDASDIDVESRIIAGQIKRLPPDQRRLLMATLNGFLLELEDHSED